MNIKGFFEYIYFVGLLLTLGMYLYIIGRINYLFKRKCGDCGKMKRGTELLFSSNDGFTLICKSCRGD